MGKFGFNYITDEAREQLEKDGIRLKREPISNGFMWAIFTDISDLFGDEMLDRMPDINPDNIEYFETKKRRNSQVMRHWYCKDNETYYYLIREHVYQCTLRKTKDYRTDPPTIDAKTLFDLCEEPGSIEDILRARHPSFSGKYALF